MGTTICVFTSLAAICLSVAWLAGSCQAYPGNHRQPLQTEKHHEDIGNHREFDDRTPQPQNSNITETPDVSNDTTAHVVAVPTEVPQLRVVLSGEEEGQYSAGQKEETKSLVGDPEVTSKEVSDEKAARPARCSWKQPQSGTTCSSVDPATPGKSVATSSSSNTIGHEVQLVTSEVKFAAILEKLLVDGNALLQSAMKIIPNLKTEFSLGPQNHENLGEPSAATATFAGKMSNLFESMKNGPNIIDMVQSILDHLVSLPEIVSSSVPSDEIRNALERLKSTLSEVVKASEDLLSQEVFSKIQAILGDVRLWPPHEGDSGNYKGTSSISPNWKDWLKENAPHVHAWIDQLTSAISSMPVSYTDDSSLSMTAPTLSNTEPLEPINSAPSASCKSPSVNIRVNVPNPSCLTSESSAAPASQDQDTFGVRKPRTSACHCSLTSSSSNSGGNPDAINATLYSKGNPLHRGGQAPAATHQSTASGGAIPEAINRAESKIFNQYASQSPPPETPSSSSNGQNVPSSRPPQQGQSDQRPLTSSEDGIGPKQQGPTPPFSGRQGPVVDHPCTFIVSDSPSSSSSGSWPSTSSSKSASVRIPGAVIDVHVQNGGASEHPNPEYESSIPLVLPIQTVTAALKNNPISPGDIINIKLPNKVLVGRACDGVSQISFRYVDTPQHSEDGINKVWNISSGDFHDECSIKAFERLHHLERT